MPPIWELLLPVEAVKPELITPHELVVHSLVPPRCRVSAIIPNRRDGSVVAGDDSSSLSRITRIRAEAAFFVGVALIIVRRGYTLEGNQVLPLRHQCGVCGFL